MTFSFLLIDFEFVFKFAKFICGLDLVEEMRIIQDPYLSLIAGTTIGSPQGKSFGKIEDSFILPLLTNNSNTAQFLTIILTLMLSLY